MAFSEFETTRYQKMLDAFIAKRRPPQHIRSQLDFVGRIVNQSVEIIEVRPNWLKPDEIIEHPVAKATYVKRRGVWHVYWMRADLKWHRYDPDASTQSLDDFFAIVHADEYSCFFG